VWKDARGSCGDPSLMWWAVQRAPVRHPAAPGAVAQARCGARLERASGAGAPAEGVSKECLSVAEGGGARRGGREEGEGTGVEDAPGTSGGRLPRANRARGRGVGRTSTARARSTPRPARRPAVSMRTPCARAGPRGGGGGRAQGQGERAWRVSVDAGRRGPGRVAPAWPGTPARQGARRTSSRGGAPRHSARRHARAPPR